MIEHLFALFLMVWLTVVNGRIAKTTIEFYLLLIYSWGFVLLGAWIYEH